MLRQLSLLVLLTASAAATPASAQQPSAGNSPKKAAYDPNERICEDLYVGTRVNRHRFCGTRAEWEAMKQQDRQEVERKQRPLQCNKIMGKSC
jgi:hypothetical protein